VNYREVARKLQALGCQEVPRKGGGSHRKWRNPANSKTTVVPDGAATILSSARSERPYAS
jgi:predicted RNA binding protein YcfA (HicA-like mRNA interferase family)